MLAEYIQQKKQEKGIALMTHAVVGYPDRETWRDLAHACVRGGADVLELQIPFSDPLADGHTIRQANEKALHSFDNMEELLSSVQEFVSGAPVPVVVMSYFNPILRFGPHRFLEKLKDANVQGLIVPDMNIDEEGFEHFWGLVGTVGLDTIQIVTPDTGKERMGQLATHTRGFVYATARMGVTGVRDQDMELDTYLSLVRDSFSVPVAVGFGISQKSHVEALFRKADMVIVGSAVIDVFERTKDVGSVKDFVRSLRVE